MSTYIKIGADAVNRWNKLKTFVTIEANRKWKPHDDSDERGKINEAKMILEHMESLE